MAILMFSVIKDIQVSVVRPLNMLMSLGDGDEDDDDNDDDGDDDDDDVDMHKWSRVRHGFVPGTL